VSPAVGNIIFDTCTLSNFSAVGRLDLLEGRYGYRARWTETIQIEISRGRKNHAHLQDVLDAAWLGEPIEIDADTAALREIDIVRRALGGSSAEPLQHLGEAEAIYYLQHVEPNGIFATDDQAALDFAKNRGVFAINSARMLAECYQSDEVGCPEAYDLLLAMRREDRGVWIPADHRAVCP
jgi:hypothetical protein